MTTAYDITDYDKKPRVLSLGKTFLRNHPDALLSGPNILIPPPDENKIENEKNLYNPFECYDEDILSFSIRTASAEEYRINCKKKSSAFDDYLTIRNSNSSGAKQFTGYMYFHTLFASINQLPQPAQNQAILMWVKHFGVPRKYILEQAISRAKKLNMPCATIPLKYFRRDLQLFSHAMDISITCKQLLKSPADKELKQHLIDLLNFKTTSAPQPILHFDNTSYFLIAALRNGVDAETQKQIQLKYKELAEPVIQNDPVQFAFKTMAALIDCTTFKPTLSYDSKNKAPLLSWVCDDAMTAMWTMLLFDFTSTRFMRRCASSKCNCFFAATRESGRFCSKLCQTSVGVKNLRNRTAQAKKCTDQTAPNPTIK